MTKKQVLTGGKKRKTLKVKRTMLKKGKKRAAKTKKRGGRKSVRRGGAIGFPSRYYGAAHDTSTLTENAKLSTAKPFPANTTWNSFASVGPIDS
tara:strand:+ start:37056 stop:37337 length:282 start_codon:yes stop_codon:yes gene_type:complete